MCSRTWRDFAENTASRPGSSLACSRVLACCPSGCLDRRLLPQGDGAQFRARSGHQSAGANASHRGRTGLIGLGSYRAGSVRTYQDLAPRPDGAGSCQGHLRCADLFVGTEMFWGNDRLDDALLFVAKQKVLKNMHRLRALRLARDSEKESADRKPKVKR